MNMQKNKMKISTKHSTCSFLIAVASLLMLPVTSAWASSLAITGLNFSSLAGDKVQVHLAMNGPASTPKVFQTDKPARIALDFSGVSSELKKKLFKVNQGAAGEVYVVEASGRTRVVINLIESVPYETRVEGNSVYIVLKPKSRVDIDKPETRQKQVDTTISSLLPEQTIKKIDFRRGPKGEGRLLLALSSPNTVVDVQERAGKVILNFLNTKLPAELVKHFDVVDFATPVQSIDARPRGAGVSVSIATVDGNYDYSSYQSDGLFTVDFLPLTRAEKEAKLKSKFNYVGNKLSLNFQDIEVRDVLQILADFTNLNIVAADSVAGNVTLRLNDVPWDQALDLILKSKGLAQRKAGNVVMVAPTAEIIKIEEDELLANKVEEQLEPLKTEYIRIQFAKAEEIQALLTGQNVVRSSNSQSSQLGGSGLSGQSKNSQRESETTRRETDGLLSERGRSTVDSRTNTLIVRDTAKQLEEIRAMISLLDVPIRQVMIESRIVIAETNFAKNLGVKFGVAKTGLDIGSGKFFSLGGANQTVKTSNALNGTNPVVEIPDNNALVDLAAAGIKSHPVGALGMTLARAADYVLNLELTALENNGGGEVLANPRVMTIDREMATIKQGVQIPYTTVSQDGTETQLVDAVLELKVTPQITPSGEVIMDLMIKKDSPDLSTGGIQKREIQTNVQVRDGETIVLGGIYEQLSGKEIFKIPFFGDLPGIGFLFKKTEISDDKKEMLIFVTPKIVKDSLSLR